jgi:hypothetical protein
MLKKLTLAALAATFITGSIGLAHAESGLSTAAGDLGSSAWMQQDMSVKEAAAAKGQSYTNAYGYAPARQPARSHYARSSAKTKHNN